MNRILTKWKIVALAITLLIVSLSVIVIMQEQNPAPTETPEQFVVTTVTASPSNTTYGLVTVEAEVRNNGIQNQTVFVVMQIQEPN